jgi:hypothetical protein
MTHPQKHGELTSQAELPCGRRGDSCRPAAVAADATRRRAARPARTEEEKMLLRMETPQKAESEDPKLSPCGSDKKKTR